MPLRHARGHTSTANSTAGMKYHRNSGDANDMLFDPPASGGSSQTLPKASGDPWRIRLRHTDHDRHDDRGPTRGRPAPHNRLCGLGLLLLLYGIVPLAWTVYALSVRETPIEEFFRALVWPEVDDPVRAMTPYEW